MTVNDPSSAALAPRRVASLRRGLREWYQRERRDLPWRGSSDPYAIWVSEVMLQQTTVAAVLPYWKRFLSRFPTVETLAAAPRDEVLAEWSGLGYYRRARHLHDAARVVAKDLGGRIPRSTRELRRLPGIGEYTAAAVASIAFGAAVSVVDGNVARCLARVARIDGDPRRHPARGALSQLAERLLDDERPGDHNQALMELGATVCTPRAPRCELCPWSRACLAHAAGAEDQYPSPAPRPRSIDVVTGHVLVTGPRGRVLMNRVPEGRANAGMIELPSATLYHGERDAGAAPRSFGSRLARRLERRLAAETGLAVRVGDLVTRETHGITRHRIVAFLARARLAGPAPSGRSWSWATPRQARGRALTALARRLLHDIEPSAATLGRPTGPRRGVVVLRD